MTKKTIIILQLSLIIFLIFTSFCIAADERPLTLREAFLEALSRNLTITVQKLTPVSAELDVESAKAVYYPTFTQGVTLSRNIITKAESRGSTTAFSEKLPVGGTLSVELGNKKSMTTDKSPMYQSALGVSLSLPLLSGAGWYVNQAPILIAEKSSLTSKLALREQIETLLVNVNSAYWSLKLAMEELNIQKDSYDQALKLHERTLELIKEGELAEIEKFQTEAALSNREESVVNAEKAVKDAHDTILNLLNLELTTHSVSPIDLPKFDFFEPEYDKSFEAAMSNRADYLQAVENLKTSEINLNVSRNNALPELTLTTGYSTGSADQPGSLSKTLRNLDEEKSWSVGMNFSIPLPNTVKRNAYAKSKISYDQASITLEQTKENIKKDLRQTIRGMLTARKKIDVTKKALEFAQKKLEAEEIKLQEGFSDNFTVINFQNDLISSKLAEVKATIDYQIALLAMKKSEGRLLPYLNISFADEFAKRYEPRPKNK